MNRHDGVVDPLIAVLVGIDDGTERARILLLFRTLVDEAAEFAGNGPAVEVGFHEVLLDFRADVFKQVADMADDRVDAQHSTAFLQHVVIADQYQGDDDHPEPVQRRPQLRQAEDDEGYRDAGNNECVANGHGIQTGESFARCPD